MSRFNEGWWNCFLSYTDVISFSMAAYDFARDQMNDIYEWFFKHYFNVFNLKQCRNE